MEENMVVYKDDCFFYLHEALDDFLKKYNTTIKTVEIGVDDWYEIDYTIEISVNNKTFNFIITEILNKDDDPRELIYYCNDIYYIGGSKIFNQIIEIVMPEFIVNELNEIDKLLEKEEHEIDNINFQIKTAANLVSKFALPAEVALLCF